VYKVPLGGFDAEKVFHQIEELKSGGQLKISEWGIGQCSLEDVFT
jgi:hypothetical protein